MAREVNGDRVWRAANVDGVLSGGKRKWLEVLPLGGSPLETRQFRRSWPDGAGCENGCTSGSGRSERSVVLKTACMVPVKDARAAWEEQTLCQLQISVG